MDTMVETPGMDMLHSQFWPEQPYVTRKGDSRFSVTTRKQFPHIAINYTSYIISWDQPSLGRGHTKQAQLFRSGVPYEVALYDDVETGERLIVGGDWCWG